MILVTGASGFLGKCLISRLKSLGLGVILLDYGNDVSTVGDCWTADLTKIEHINVLKKTEITPDVVIHLAGHIEISLIPNPRNYYQGPIAGRENIYLLYLKNVMMTANIIDYCQNVGVDRLFFASSQAVYGFPTENILTENSICRPLEYYASSKLCAESMLEIASKQGIKVMIFRFPGLYSQSRLSGVVYKFCKAAFSQKYISVDIDYPLPFDCIHVEDVVNAYVAALMFKQFDFLKLNIATGQPCNLNILAELIAKMVPGCCIKYADVTQPIISMDSSLAQKLLNWVPLSREQRLNEFLNGIKSDKSISASC